MKASTPALIIFSVLSVAACGPIQSVKFQSPAANESVEVVTSPSGAIASNDFGNTCITPCRLPISRTAGGSILISHEGYRTERHFIGTDVASEPIVENADQYINDRDPEGEAIKSVLLAVAAKDRLKRLDVKKIELTMTPLAEGEEDPLAPDVAISGDLFSSYRPITGERIPIDISDDDVD